MMSKTYVIQIEENVWLKDCCYGWETEEARTSDKRKAEEFTEERAYRELHSCHSIARAHFSAKVEQSVWT